MITTTLSFKAKVRLSNEQMMEAEDTYDLGNIAKSKDWEWQMIALPVEDIKRLISFNSSKTIVVTIDDEKILVAEPFEDLKTKWDSTRELYFRLTELPLEAETNEDSEQSSEDDTN